MVFHLVSDRKGWTWDQWENTPALIQNLVWTYMQAEAEAKADATK